MGLFNSIRKALRGGKALPHEHGPKVKFALQGEELAKCPVDHKNLNIKVVKATANDNPACVCGQGAKCYCKAGDAKKATAKKTTTAKPKTATTTAKKTPAKPAAKSTAKAPAKKPAPKKK